MTQNAWQNADTNIQYRILNALIKENIWQEQTIITTKDDQLDIQYHGCILSTHFNHNSVMSRYEFVGPITFRCGTNIMEVSTVEALLDMLSNHFDINIHHN